MRENLVKLGGRPYESPGLLGGRTLAPSRNLLPRPLRKLSSSSARAQAKKRTLPVGAELKKSIARALNIRLDDFGVPMIGGDAVIMDALQTAVARQEPPFRSVLDYLQACRRIRDAMPHTPLLKAVRAGLQ